VWADGISSVLPPAQQWSPLIRQAVCDLLEDPGYRRRAAAVRQPMHQQPGVERGVKLFESITSH
jgi:UDP:flavonoid glycosyltransferase YjiC (YdhE family)